MSLGQAGFVNATARRENKRDGVASFGPLQVETRADAAGGAGL